MQPLGERLGEAVGERRGEDRRVVVVGRLELGDQPSGPSRPCPAVTAKAPTWSASPVSSRRDEVGERDVRATVGLGDLLAQRVERARAARSRVSSGHSDDVVAVGVGRPEADDAGRAQPFARRRSARSSALGVVEQVAGGLADRRVVEDRRVGAAQLPGREERRPVDALDELVERVVVERRARRGTSVAAAPTRRPVDRDRGWRAPRRSSGSAPSTGASLRARDGPPRTRSRIVARRRPRAARRRSARRRRRPRATRRGRGRPGRE